jgi:three-Cys-motif partner protein
MEFDQIGNWTEVKLEIIKKYAKAYTTLLSKKGFKIYYIDAFSGPGVHVSRKNGKIVKGSPLNAIEVQPPFNAYLFIDLDGDKIEFLRNTLGNEDNIRYHSGDCNPKLIEVLPKITKEKGYRAVCILDPYGLDIDWKVVELAGKARTIDLFIHFPIMGINRTALWRNPEAVPPENIACMNKFWGNESWRDIAYEEYETLLGDIDKEKASNRAVAEAFKQHLITDASFRFVPEPIPMKNSKGSTIYYLFFAAHVQVADKIINAIFKKYR